MDQPYHSQLHNILISKGFNYRRYNYLFDLSCDHYMDHEGTTIIFYRDDSIETIDNDGKKLSIDKFDEITNHIFNPDGAQHVIK
jgi:hypothetical protein